MKAIISFVVDTAKVVIVALVIVLPIRAFVFQPFLVRGDSMDPNFHNGDYLIVDELSYRLREPERGEVIVLKFPQDPSQRYIKRIVGLPGDTVEIKEGRVVIATQSQEFMVLDESGYLLPDVSTSGSAKVALREDEYFVLGDNRHFSSDSRRWGVLPKEYIVGRALFRLYPLNAFTTVAAPNY